MYHKKYWPRLLSILCLSLYALCLPSLTWAQSARPDYAIICPILGEAKPILALMHNKHQQHRGELTYWSGQLGKQRVVLLLGGVGETDIAVTTTLLIETLRPKTIILAGSAGGLGRHVHVGDVILGDKFYLLNFGKFSELAPSSDPTLKNPINQAKEQYTLKTDKVLLERIAKRSQQLDLSAHNQYGRIVPAKVSVDSIATSQFFPTPKMDIDKMAALGTKTIAMEDASFMKTCWMLKQACMVVRGISDKLGAEASKNPYVAWNKRNLRVAMRNVAQVVSNFLS